MNKTLSPPQTMVWHYFQALRRLCASIELQHNSEEIQQDAVLGVILAVTGVEVFFNVYFRNLVDELEFNHAREYICGKLNPRTSLDEKIKRWPQEVFKKKLHFGSGPGQKFLELKKLRNRLIHFSSSHENISLPGFNILGMADTSIYSSLSASSAKHALEIAEQFICEVFKLRGLSEQNCLYGLHSWTGRVPESET